MIAQAIPHHIAAFLKEKAQVRTFSMLLGGCAFFATITLTLPVEFLVVVGVLVSPARWLRVSLWAAFGSSLGTAGLYFAFHHFGWNLLVAWYPDLVTSQLWADTTRWLSRYGAIALFLLMAVPFPVAKTPALAFVTIYRMPIVEVALAIGLGKLLKYVVYAFIVSRFPASFSRAYAAMLPRRP
jgi:membrane protein YqaA with SNARE-associated domain